MLDELKVQQIRRTEIECGVLPDMLVVYEEMASAPGSFLLESADRLGVMGRFTLIGMDPILKLRASGEEAVLSSEDGKRVQGDNPFGMMARVLEQSKVEFSDVFPEMPFVSGGLAGWIGYDAVCHIEDINMRLPKSDALDDVYLVMPRHLLVADRETERITLVSFEMEDADSEKALHRHERIRHRLDGVLEKIKGIKQVNRSLPRQDCESAGLGRDGTEMLENWTSVTSRDDFIRQVDIAKDHIRRGDAFQLVFSRRLSRTSDVSASELYRALRTSNPSPYMFLIASEQGHVIGASPETLVNMRAGNATVHPIAGTRPRGKNALEDSALEAELREDVKENAEHLMLVDLARNDLGRVSENGSVEVTKFKSIERFSHVMHIVSEVRGRIRQDLGVVDVFKACFPAGTVSGAPKIRAMEIIEANEKERRGVYAGAVGWFGFNREMDTCIAIRTAVLKDGVISVQAGGGLVQDSLPHMEYMETVHKSAGVMRAVELAEKGQSL